MRASVLLPFRDAEPTLGAALDSLLRERFDFEIVAVDDGSRDDGAALVASFAARDSRVRLVRTAPLGLVAALERARSEARAPVLVRMDADDVSLNERIAREVTTLEGDASIGLIATQVELRSEEPVGEGLCRYVAWQNTLLSASDHAREVFVESPLCHPTFAMRREVLEALGGYRDGPFPEDYDLVLRVHAAGLTISKLPFVGLAWTHSSGRLTFRDPRYSTDAFRTLKIEHLRPMLARESRPLVVWGAGRDGRRFLRELLSHGVSVTCVVDISPKKIGRTIYGLPIVTPDSLPARADAFVVVSVGTRGARELIRADLDARGYRELEDYRCVA